MKTRVLGKNGPRFRPSASVAWACPSSTARKDDAESIATINAPLDLGLNFLDTGRHVRLRQNERLVGQAIKGVGWRLSSRRNRQCP